MFTKDEYKLADELPPELKNKIESIDRSAYHVVADLDRGMISLKCLLKLDEVKREFYDCLEMIQVTYRFKTKESHLQLLNAM